ncbi:MAG: hypothetical protein PCFJNLEI_00543 [Verrucomicrobiae bacterium]|nr:hypothetical protein [Verrucomicrobiae bacterium]
MNRYRLAVDDGIFFLRDIAAKRYRSIFDCPFLGMLRSLQTKVVINVFFETPDADFNLAAMPADYRAEWADNADWLRLAFHARREFPDRPYANTTTEILARDYDDIAGEVLRFAGAATWSPTTVIHWCQLPAEVLPVLAARGVRVLSGLFGRGINYGLDAAFCERVAKTGTATDPQSGITFSRIDLILNATPVEQVVPALERMVPDRVLDLLTHEQYSWPFYRRYLPDHTERLETAVRWCAERGFEPVFLHSGSM